ncbi:MAG: hypothetical protein JWL70_2773, partial [Acidimicrobiia bacterium]|nr:hypothetical protein [Acidimicrobiia bacterium]
PPEHQRVPASRLRWWREVLYVLVFYIAYSSVRNLFGSAQVSPHRAFENARHLIRVEDALSIFHEASVQSRFIGEHWFMRFWNIYYGTAHFVVTAGALIWLYHRQPARYARWRNALAFMTGLALVGFALFPLMPPRLLNDATKYGGAGFATHQYGFVDSLAKIGGLWSFDSGTVAKLSNQYAAMPSLHCAWATWCAFVLWPLVRRPWAKTLVLLYPFATLFCIVVTANHYWLDGVGGLLTFAVGCLCGFQLAAFWVRRAERHSSDTAVVEPQRAGAPEASRS